MKYLVLTFIVCLIVVNCEHKIKITTIDTIQQVVPNLLVKGWRISQIIPQSYPYNLMKYGESGIEVLLEGSERKVVMSIQIDKIKTVEKEVNYIPQYCIWFMPLRYKGEHIDRSRYQDDGPIHYAQYIGCSSRFTVYVKPVQTGSPEPEEFPMRLLKNSLQKHFKIQVIPENL